MDNGMRNDRNRSSETLPRPAVMGDRMIIKSRSPVFALTTALSCGLTAVVLLFQGAWEWSVGLTVFSVSMWVWHVRVVFLFAAPDGRSRNSDSLPKGRR